MPLFSQTLSKISPSLLRAIRLNIFMDIERLLKDLPLSGHVLDLGCGYGQVVSYLAELRPNVQFMGVDIDPRAIAAAKRMWPLSNLKFEVSDIAKSYPGFDNVLLLHVLHHVPIQAEQALIKYAAEVLRPKGRLIMEEMEYGHCQLGIFLDTYISNAPPMVRTDKQLSEILSPSFNIINWERYRKAQIGNSHLIAEKI